MARAASPDLNQNAGNLTTLPTLSNPENTRKDQHQPPALPAKPWERGKIVGFSISNLNKAGPAHTKRPPDSLSGNPPTQSQLWEPQSSISPILWGGRIQPPHATAPNIQSSSKTPSSHSFLVPVRAPALENPAGYFYPQRSRRRRRRKKK